MFTSIEGFDSSNSLTSLQDGNYMILESEYQSLDGLMSATLKEMQLAGTTTQIACDLIVVLPDASVLFRDFLRMPDSGWRDSYGRRADELVDLLPPELANLRLVSRTSSSVLIEAGALFPATLVSMNTSHN